MWGWVILFGIAAWLVYQWMSIPIPEGYTTPYFRKLLVIAFKLVKPIMHFGEDYLKIDNWYLGFLRLVNVSPKPGSALSSKNVTVTVEDLGGVRCLIYTPKTVSTNKIIFYIHGGGWIFATADTYNPIVSKIARRLEVKVISVDYRSAPEHIFPAAIDDVTIAYKSLIEKSESYGFDKSQVTIAGDSAGGNLVAALTLRLRDEKYQHTPKLQVMIYPFLQTLDFKTPSYHYAADDPFLGDGRMLKDAMMHYAMGSLKYRQKVYADDFVPKDVIEKYRQTYLNPDTLPKDLVPDSYVGDDIKPGDVEIWNQLKDKVLHPYFSPVLADDLSNLPKAFVLTANYDVLRDEGIWYAQRLKDAGNEVKLINFKAGYHLILFDNVEFVQTLLTEIKENW